MSLKQSIVIVNEYTVKLPGGGGSRGASPGDYITRYMARELATEAVAPIRHARVDHFIQRYMAREDAVESLDLPETPQLKRKMKKAQKDGGVAFGYGSPSLSHEELHAASEDVQRLFDNGHTVMKTVLSFDQEYLRQQGLIDEDFQLRRRGDYRGKLDQLKLRLAIMHGLERMNQASYDDLRAVNVIQVDTEHVHCHLAMVDAGKGSLAADGTQRGKINSRAKSFLRRGIDSYLDEKQKVKHLSSAVGYERRNVTTFVKRWAHKQMLRESLPQFLLATLPEDRRLWRSSTNHRAMRKPNQIVREMVAEVLERPESPMGAAMAKVQDYANQRREREGLTGPKGEQAWQKLIDDGREQIIERGVNSVYATLRQMPEDSLQIRTGMLDAMSMDYQEMAQRAHQEDEDDIVGFGFRLRSYSSRMNHHEEEREFYHEQVRAWESADEQGLATVDSRALYDFYLEEEEYNARCAAKYRKFLAFTPPRETWYEPWQQIAEYGDRMLSLESMRSDADLRKMKNPDEAEDHGFKIYGQRGGHLLSLGEPENLKVLDERIEKMRRSYDTQVQDFRVTLAGKGLRLETERDPKTGRDVPTITRGTEFPFDETKGLDLHHMRYDFSRDVDIGSQAKAQFVNAAQRRAASLENAVSYLHSSEQTEMIQHLPVRDIQSMVDLAAQIRNDGDDPKLVSRVAELQRAKTIARRSRTMPLTTQVSVKLNEAVIRSTSEIEFEAEAEPMPAPDRDEGIV